MAETTTEMVGDTEMVHTEDVQDDVKAKRTPDEEIRKLSAENKKRLQQLIDERKKREEIEKRLEKIENEKLAEDKKWEDLAKKREQEKADVEKAANEKVAAAQRRAALAEAKRIARDKGMRAEAVKDLERFLPEIEFDDDGEPMALDDMVEDLKSSRAYLFQPSKVADEDKEDKSDKRDKKIATPVRKEDAHSSKDWAKAGKDEFSSELSKYGVRV